MTQATPQQLENLGTIKENVRFNEKTIDEIKYDIRDIRGDIKALDNKVSRFSQTFDNKLAALSQAFDNKLEALSQAFDDKLEARSKETDGKIERLEGRIDSLEGRIDSLEEKITALSEQFQTLGWKGFLGIMIIVLANVVLKFLPG